MNCALGALALSIALLAPLNAAATGEKDDRVALDELGKRVSKAINAVDVDAVVAELDENCLFVNIPGTVTRGRDGIRKYFDFMLQAKDAYLKSMSFEMIPDGDPLVFDGKFALIHGIALNHYEYAAGGKLDLPTFWTVSAVKRDGRWKMSSLQISANVFKNPLLGHLYGIFGIALVIAVGLAGGLGYGFGRRRVAGSRVS